MNSMKRQKDRTLKDKFPRLVGAKYTTGDQWRNSSRKNEEAEPKQKQTGEGVHQGCILSPYLFNLYAECIMQNARMDEAQAGIKIAGRIPLLGIHTKETRSERDTCTPMFIAALFIIARTWEQPRCPSADE